MLRFYNTTKTRGAAAGATAPPQRRPWQGRLSLFMLMFVLMPALSFAQTTASETHTYNYSYYDGNGDWAHYNGRYYDNNINGTSSELYFHHFGFNIPAGAIIDSIVVSVAREADDVNYGRHIEDYSAYLRYGNNGSSHSSLNKAIPGYWASSQTTVTYGNNDTWGTTFTAADINSNNFGFAIAVTGSGGNGNNRPDAYVYEPTITVYYTESTLTLNSTTGNSDATYGSVGSVKSFAVTATGITGNCSVSGGTNFEVSSTANGTFGATTTITAGSNVSVYFRLKNGLDASTTPYSNNIVVSATGATSKNFAATGTVSPKTLNLDPSGLSATKVYDGNATASVNGTMGLTGVLPADVADVTATSATAYSYVSTDAGNPVNVSANDFVLTGSKASNYSLTSADTTFSGVITPKHLTLKTNGTFTTAKPYDGTTAVNNADVTGGTYTLEGVVLGENVTFNQAGVSYVYADSNVGNPIVVTGSGYGVTFGIGVNGNNYTFNGDTTISFDGVIIKKNATITASNQTKCYDIAFSGVSDSTHFTDTGFVAGEGVVAVNLASTGSGSQATAGNYPIVPSNAVANSATDLNNYEITYVNGVLEALPKLAVYINTVANQDVCAGNSISLNYTLEGPGILSADLLISKVDGLVTPFDTFHIGSKTAGSSQSVTIPDSLTPNMGNTDVKYRLTWLNVTSDSINCDGITNGQVDVTIHPAPALAVSYTDSTICSGNDWTVGLSNPNAITGATYKIVANYGAATGNIPAGGVTNNFGVSSYTDHLVNNSGAPVVVTYTITSKSPSPDNCDGAYEIVSITVNPNPVLAAVVADSVCEGSMTTITLNGLDANGNYDIEGTIAGNFDNNGTSGTFSFPGLTGSFTADASGNYSFSYPTVYGDSVVTDYAAQVTKLTYSATGCSIDYTDSNKIGNGVVHPLPTDMLEVNGMAISNNATKAVCEGSTVTVNVSGDTANTYSLYRSDNSTLVVPSGHVGDSTYSFTAQLSDDGLYYLHLMSPYGCEVVDTIDLSVNPLPVATLMAQGSALNNGDSVVVCEASSVTLELTGTLSTDDYVLLHGTDTVGIGHPNDPVFTFPASLGDAGMYYLHVMNSDGCGIVDTFQLVVNPLPTDVFKVNGNVAANGDTVEVCENSPVTLSLTGNTADSFALYQQNNVPTFVPGPGPNLVGAGHVNDSAYTFTASAFNDAGTYYLHLFNEHGCETIDTIELVVNPLPAATFTFNTDTLTNGDSVVACVASPVTLELTGDAHDSYVLLQGADTVGIGSPNDPAFVFDASMSDAGTYYLHLMNSHGCGTVDTFYFEVSPKPTFGLTINGATVTANDSATATNFCISDSVALGLAVDSGYTLTLAIDGGSAIGPMPMPAAIDTAFVVPVGIFGAGVHSLTMTVANANGCDSSITTYFNVHPLPVFSTTSVTPVSCNGSNTGAFSFKVENVGVVAETYTLTILDIDNNNDTVYSAQASSVSAGGDFTGTQQNLFAGNYKVVVANAYSCGTVDTVIITEPDALSLNMTHTDVSCGSVTPDGQLKVKPEGGVVNGGNYSITLNGPGANNAQYTAPEGTFYTINQLGGGVYTVTLTDDNACTLTQTDTIKQPSANVVTTVSGSDTVDLNASASVTLSATGAALPVTYTYTVNGGAAQTVTSSASSADVSLTVPTSTAESVVYAITGVTDANGTPCGITLGSHTVEVVDASVVDLRPIVDIVSGSLNTQYNTTDGSIALLNSGNESTSGTVTLLVSKPSSSISLDFSAATGWTVTQVAGFYQLQSSSVISGNNGYVIIPFTATLSSGGQSGSYQVNVSIIAGSGGDNNAANNNMKASINVSQ